MARLAGVLLCLAAARASDVAELFGRMAGLVQKDVGALEELQLPLLQDVKAAFTHLRNDSNVSLEDQAKEQVAALVNSVKSVVKEEEEEEKSFLAKGQSCKRKCAKKMDRHLGNTCEHLEFRLQEAKKVEHDHLIESVKNALSVCKQSAKHHAEYCKWRCWRDEL